MLTIRDSRDDDTPAIAAIYRHHVLHGVSSFELEPPSPAEMADRRRAIVDRGLPHVVAELDGSIGGYAYLGPYRPRPAYRYTVEDSVYVDHGMRGQGIGRSLLAALIARAETLDMRQMVGIVGIDRDPAERERNASIRLHRSLGFRQTGVIEGAGFKFGRWLDTVVLQRSIGPGTGQLP